MDHLLSLYVWQSGARVALRQRLVRDESGEGVISAAIAVLVMAFLGVLMWTLFKDTLTNANDNVNTELDKIK
jgi:Flp pilus assembly pilin Flp